MAHSHPDCPASDPAECRIRVVSQTMTAIAWEPIHDGNGVMVNSDPNTFSTTKVCDACGAEWVEERNAAASAVDNVDTTTPPGAMR